MLKDFIPQGYCLGCKNCCRFLNRSSFYRPVFSKNLLRRFKDKEIELAEDLRIIPIKEGDYFFCPFLERSSYRCKIYEERPFDCRFYPFILYKDKCRLFLGLDINCPFIQEVKGDSYLEEYLNYLKEELAKPYIQRKILDSLSSIFSNKEENFLELGEIPFLEDILNFSSLSLDDREIFNSYPYRENSFYDFSSIYMHEDLFTILKRKMDEGYIFFGCQEDSFWGFLILFQNLNADSTEEIFRILKKYNDNPGFSVVHNLPERFLSQLDYQRYTLDVEAEEYVYLRENITSFRGNRYKSFRWQVNFFKKNYPYRLNFLRPEDRDVLLAISRLWREYKYKEDKDISLSLLEDSYFMYKTLIDNIFPLDLRGLILYSNDRPIGFSLGKDFDNENFLILAEITIPSYKGSSTFIFQEFARTTDRKYLNCMDASFLPSLKDTKERFKPERKIKRYRLSKKDGSEQNI